MNGICFFIETLFRSLKQAHENKPTDTIFRGINSYPRMLFSPSICIVWVLHFKITLSNNCLIELLLITSRWQHIKNKANDLRQVRKYVRNEQHMPLRVIWFHTNEAEFKNNIRKSRYDDGAWCHIDLPLALKFLSQESSESCMASSGLGVTLCNWYN